MMDSENLKHDHDFNTSPNNEDYYGGGGTYKNLDDHYSNPSNMNKQPLIDFNAEDDYYGHEPYNKTKTPTPIKDDTNFKKPEKLDNKESPLANFKGKHVTPHDTHTGEASTGSELFNLNFDTIRDKVKDLIYWRDVKISGAVFCLSLLILFTLSHFSIISVLGYVGLGLLACTVGFYLYRNLMQTLNKTKQGHVFKDYLDQDMVISPETGKKISAKVISQLNYVNKQAKHLFLVEDPTDTVKFGFILWAMTYIGAYFNGLTLFVLVFVSIFTIPKIYSVYKVQINDAANKAKVVIDKNKDSAIRSIKDKAQMVKEKVSKIKKKA